MTQPTVNISTIEHALAEVLNTNKYYPEEHQTTRTNVVEDIKDAILFFEGTVVVPKLMEERELV